MVMFFMYVPIQNFQNQNNFIVRNQKSRVGEKRNKQNLEKNPNEKKNAPEIKFPPEKNPPEKIPPGKKTQPEKIPAGKKPNRKPPNREKKKTPGNVPPGKSVARKKTEEIWMNSGPGDFNFHPNFRRLVGRRLGYICTRIPKLRIPAATYLCPRAPYT